MATQKSKSKKVTMTWRELESILSKAQVLSPDKQIANLTLVKPRALLIATELKSED